MSHSLGFHMITAGSIRYRFWSAWGLPNTDIARALAFASTSFLLGMILISGLVLMFEPPGTMELLRLPAAPLRVVGALLVTGVIAFLVWMRLAIRPIRLFGTELPIPRARLALGHLLIAASDWAMAACVAWVLLPAGHGITLFHFIGVFPFALLVGAIGHVPGGVGVFETLVVLMLKPWLAPPEVLGPLILYRLIYYVLPFVAGLILMVAHEATRHGTAVFTTSEKATKGFPAFMSLAAGTTVFSAGTLMLLSTAVKMNVERMTALGSVVPLVVIEVAHVAAAATGAALLVLAWFIQCRYERAHTITVVALITAVVASLLRGLVWELAVVLIPALIVLVLSGNFFTKKGTLLRAPRSLAWGAGVLIVLVFSVWLGFFSFKGEVYTAGLWLDIALDGDLSRFVRSMSVVLTGMTGYLLLRRAPR
jgi:phosphatidylglycerol lysyltransferase